MLMMISFFIFRVCLYTYMAVVIYRSSEGLFTIPVLNRILFLSGYFGGAGLQYFWFAKILRGAYKTLIGGPSRPTEKLLKSDTVAEPEASPGSTYLVMGIHKPEMLRHMARSEMEGWFIV
ncbi:Transmembrane protein 56-B [Durusdinium trenchii]|uniref:Transmembrane protein 56-B n=1 Tax=Durusdinium trenchii TaxID=1381693 RepID=A0ABP0KX10_9DINO